MKFLARTVVLCSMTITGSLSWGAELALKTVPTSPRDEVSTAIQGVLANDTIQLVGAEGPVYQITPRKSVPLKGPLEEPRTALKQLEQGTLLGVMVVGENERDYRDDGIYPGVYTMRFALQPQDGDHLGSAEYPYFAVLIPAKSDTEVDGITGYDAVTDASKEDTATEHPVVISLRPAESLEAGATEVREPAPDHKSIRLALPATDPEGKDFTLTFELVYKGMGHI